MHTLCPSADVHKKNTNKMTIVYIFRLLLFFYYLYLISICSINFTILF